MQRLAEQGLAVVLISHNLHDIFAVADRITVLRLGRNVAVYERRATTQQEVVHAITAGVPTKVSGISQTDEHAVTTADPQAVGTEPPSQRARRHHPAAHRAAQGGRRRDAPDHPRADRDRRVLLLEERELPERRQLHEPDDADGGRHDDRHRRRLRPAARRDRPLDRLRRRRRRRGRRAAADPRRELAGQGRHRDRHRGHGHGADRRRPGRLRRVPRHPLVRRHPRRAPLLAGRDPVRDRRRGRDRDRGLDDQQPRELLLLGHRGPRHRRGRERALRGHAPGRRGQPASPRDPDGQPRRRRRQARRLRRSRSSAP